MLSAVQNWILRIVGTALVCAVVRALTPEGAGKKAVAVICGFCMLGALLGIPGAGDGGAVRRTAEDFTDQAREYARAAQEAGETQTRFIIERQSEAYILDKAAALGIPLSEVSVTARWSEEGFWVPASCRIPGEPDAALAGIIASDLGIPPERQTWGT